MNEPPAIAYIRFTDSTVRPVFEDERGQYGYGNAWVTSFAP